MEGHIHKTAKIDKNCKLGHHLVIAEKAIIGARCRIGHHVIIHQETEIGEAVRIDDHAVIGKHPMKAAISAMTDEKMLKPAEIEEKCIIGTGAVVYRGCRLGREVLVADGASVREEVEIGDKTIIGRLVTVDHIRNTSTIIWI